HLDTFSDAVACPKVDLRAGDPKYDVFNWRKPESSAFLCAECGFGGPKRTPTYTRLNLMRKFHGRCLKGWLKMYEVFTRYSSLFYKCIAGLSPPFPPPIYRPKSIKLEHTPGGNSRYEMKLSAP
ncbi:unnamed protein product, partial [Pylaiella littoralis]